MARGKASSGSRNLKPETLVVLGAERLANLIVGQAKADPVFARTVRMALAAKEDASSLAHEIDKRLKTIRRSASFLDWDKVRPLARELGQLRQTIMEPLADQSVRQAVEQMRLFLSLAESVYARADDSSGVLGDVFRQGGEDLGTLWVRAGNQNPEELAAEILSLIESDGYGVFDELPDAASPALGREGRMAMRRLLAERQAALSGEQLRRYSYKVNWLLPKLADLDDDVDAFIATVDPKRRNSLLNAEVAERLITHGRAEEALQWIDAPTDRGHNQRELADLCLRALEALGRKDLAQAERYRIFESWLDPDMLRAWLKALPDFEDFEAEQKALDVAVSFDQATMALHFLIGWPDFRRAGRFVRDRLDELEPRAYDVLRPAADALAPCDPDAATLLYRVLVSGVLDRGTSKYYPYAARDFAAARNLADAISGDGSLPSHNQWMEKLRQHHGRKSGFWSLIENSTSKLGCTSRPI
jgi:hypothetical protein